MNTEEKAKRYDEALEIAKTLYCADDVNCMDLETIFPELKESEGERIRKAIHIYLDWLDGRKDYAPKGNYTIRDMIAWLEKQGELKSIWHNEDEEPKKDSLIILIMQSGTPIVAKIIEPNHTFNHGERWAYIDDLLEKQGEQKATLIDIDAMVLKYSNTREKETNGLPVNCQIRSYRQGINDTLNLSLNIEKQGENILIEEIKRRKELYSQEKEKAVSSTEKLSLGGRIAMLEELCAFIDVKQGEQKPAWSEEDETNLTNTIIMLKEGASHHFTNFSIMPCVDWLKQLKQRHTWKPSDEQMKTLHDMNLTGNISYAGQGQTLIELYNDLKKLTE